MNLLELLAQRRTDAWIAQRGEQIAQTAFPAFRAAMALRIGGMSTSEARGYVRAKATPIVRQAAMEAVRSSRLPGRLVDRLAHVAGNRLVDLIVGPESCTRSVQRPAA